MQISNDNFFGLNNVHRNGEQRKSEIRLTEWGGGTAGGKAGKVQSKLTPHVVMTGSLKTLQHNWQHSFTDGCSAKT